MDESQRTFGVVVEFRERKRTRRGALRRSRRSWDITRRVGAEWARLSPEFVAAVALERYELDRARRIRLGVAQVAIFLGIAAFAFLACEAYLLAAIVAAVAAAKAVETESHMAP